MTFEGLKQIIFEPEHRICVGIGKPVRTDNELIIDRIEYDGDTILLSDNLNTIIGGRSTGKSTLLNSIAYKLNDGESKINIRIKIWKTFMCSGKIGRG